MTEREKVSVCHYFLRYLAPYRLGLCVGETAHLERMVEKVLESLSKEEREILEQEFIWGKDKLWYLNYYSKSTYYRLRKKAINRFINCLCKS